MSQAAAARIVETSPQSYGRMEDGRVTRVTDLGINALANAFKVDDDERRLLLDLAQEIRQTQKSDGSLWRAHADVIPKAFDHYLALEQAARRIFSWQTMFVPGLLQTREYRRALVWAEFPDMPPEEVEHILDLVMRRQDLLTNNNFQFETILTEAVVRYVVSGPAVSTDQLRHILEVSEMPNVSVRIVRFDARIPVALITRSPFVMCEFPPLPTSKLIEPPVVYIEGFAGDLYLERDIEVARYADVAQSLAQVALPEAASRDLVLTAMKERMK